MNTRIKVLIVVLCITHGLWAQDNNDIGTETVTVVRPYSPTVSDAFKIKSVPNLKDSIVLQKKKINYSIFSVPVASTFTPAKGKASAVKKAAPEKLFNSYASVGLGSFNNALLDFYTSRDINRGDERLDIGLNHHSSRGDIDSTPLDTDFYNTKLDASYTKRDRDMDWGANIGLQHQIYNWYGLPAGVFDEATINSIDEGQSYFNVEAGGQIDMEDSFFKRGELKLRRFWDGVESAENRVIIQPTLELPITEELVTVKMKFDYVGGNFKNANVNNTVNAPEINYNLMQFGINPSLLVLRDNLTLNLGANFVYGMDVENNDNNFYIYPTVTASYRLLDEVAIAYGGVEGQLKQNSYHEFVGENPFVSPTLTILPTDQQYDAYIGLKGQLLPNLSYNIKGSYTAENRRPLFTLNPQNSFRTDEKGYYFGNSFEVFYDDIKTLGIFGELNVDVNRNFSFGVNAEVYDYNTETGNPAWNLPNLKGSLFMDYQIGEKWFMGANLFFIGEREDFSSVAAENVPPSQFLATIITLDSYFDANAHLGYRLNDQLSIFAKASNIANNQYQRWANFGVQGLQILGGVTYKFDF
ncbi:MAG: TonB-dependent receptor [Flavobacteriaceae bacterium]